MFRHDVGLLQPHPLRAAQRKLQDRVQKRVQGLLRKQVKRSTIVRSMFVARFPIDTLRLR